MEDLAVPPYDKALDLTMQTIATSVLWGGTIALLIYAFKMAREERSPFPVLLVLAVAVGSLIEPLYDISWHLFWLDNGDQWTLFTSFGLPQPVWVMPAYVMVFGLPALLLYRRMSQGVDIQFIFKFAALTACTTAAFEITAINLDLYVYYGEAPMRLAGYPLPIAFVEAAQITGFAVLATVLKLRATRNLHYLALFVIFPANFAFDTLGAGFPTVIAINQPDPSTALMWISAPITIAFAATALWWTSQLLLRMPASEFAKAPDAPRAPEAAPAVDREPALA